MSQRLSLKSQESSLVDLGSVVPISRRSLFSPRSLGALLGVTSAGTVQAQAGSKSDGVKPPVPFRGIEDPIYLLLQRTSFGFTEEDYATATQMGFQAYLEWQINWSAIDDSALNTLLGAYGSLQLPISQLFSYLPGVGVAILELQNATLLRAVKSRCQLHERMVEFWSDHFSVDVNKVSVFKHVDDREVIRPNALGSFRDLLSANAHSPAMLYYLDNQSSNATTPNQNYARELLELHTLGVDNGYTQNDVNEVAKCFSGWGFYGSGAGALYGTFQFNPGRHNNGAKVVLGNNFPAGGGITDGETVVNILASHPNTARFIATKLVRKFLADVPPPVVVDAVADVFMSTNGNIAEMLRTILTPSNLINYARPRYKRPFHFVASILRSSKATITDISSSRNLLTGMGHLPFYWATPDGYPDVAEYWSGLLLPRWNFAFSLLNGNISGVSVDAATLFQGLPNSKSITNRIGKLLTNNNLSIGDAYPIQTYMAPRETDINKIREAFALGMSSPSFQWY